MPDDDAAILECETARTVFHFRIIEGAPGFWNNLFPGADRARNDALARANFALDSGRAVADGAGLHLRGTVGPDIPNAFVMTAHLQIVVIDGYILHQLVGVGPAKLRMFFPNTLAKFDALRRTIHLSIGAGWGGAFAGSIATALKAGLRVFSLGLWVWSF